MHLKSLSLRGFKTFADKTEINFEPPPEITAIVGPNGCGKSNLIDSLRFVLGGQSIKELRGNSLEELIFAGTNQRKPLSLAEISIQMDNSDHLLHTDYNEVVIKRRVFRSGESEFFINKVPCRLRDIRELFMDTGIGPGSYSIINQGQVDAVLSSKPEERREIFEEAAGIAKYKFRKRTAERKLIATEQNLLRINDLKHEIAKQQETLKNQAEKAREYQALKEELKFLEIGLSKRQVENFSQKKEQILERVRELQNSLGLADQKYELFEKTRTELRNKSDEIETETEKTRAFLESHRKRSEEIKRENILETERIKYLREKNGSLENQINDSLSYAAKLKGESESRRPAETELKKQHQEQALLVSQKESGLTEFNENIKERLKKLEDLKSPVFEKERALAESQNQLNQFRLNDKFARDEQARDKSTLNRLNSQLAENERERAAFLEDLSAIEKNQNEIRDELKIYTAEKENSENILAEIRAQKSSVKEELDQKNSQLFVLRQMQENYEGFWLGTKEALKSNLPGMLGTISRLIEVPLELQTAVETALGRSFQYIVTDTDEQALTIIKYLKAHSLGRATFIPLNIINGLSLKEIDEKHVKNEPGCRGLASKLVKTEEKSAKIISLLLGKTIIADQIDRAISILKKFKKEDEIQIVTLNGEIISSRGFLSGGKTGQTQSPILGREQEISSLAEEVGHLREKTGSLFSKEDALQTRINNLQVKINGISKQLQTQEVNHKTLKYKTEELEQKKSNLSEEIEACRGGLNARKAEIENITKKLEEASQRLSLQKEESKSLREDLNQTQDQLDSLRRQKDEFSFQLMQERVKNSETGAKLAEVLERLRIIEGEKERTQNLIREKTKEKDENNLKITESIQKLAEIENQIPLIEAEAKELILQIEILQQKRHKIKEEIEAAETRIKEETGEDRGLRDKLSKEEISLARLEGEISTLEIRMAEEYNLSLTEILNTENKIPSPANAKHEVESIKNRLRTLEPVNLLAIEEYESGAGRLDFIETQYQDLIKSRENLNNLIAELDQKAKDVFLKTFNKICENFSLIYKTLFEGGEAKIVLEEEKDILEAGVEIIAKPYGKKWLSLSLLSGGERSLTAIALLFSILKTKPSPFCLLDEVDAALDEINTDRFTRILKDFSSRVQIMLITHSKRTMESCGTMYGVTMEEPGVSKIVSVKLAKVEV